MDVPTGATPMRQMYAYPSGLQRTRAHAQLIEEFWTQRAAQDAAAQAPEVGVTIEEEEEPPAAMAASGQVMNKENTEGAQRAMPTKAASMIPGKPLANVNQKHVC